MSITSPVQRHGIYYSWYLFTVCRVQLLTVTWLMALFEWKQTFSMEQIREFLFFWAAPPSWEFPCKSQMSTVNPSGYNSLDAFPLSRTYESCSVLILPPIWDFHWRPFWARAESGPSILCCFSWSISCYNTAIVFLDGPGLVWNC